MLFHLDFRGDQAGPQTEPDWVLPAQVLPAFRHQQSQVSCRHRVPLQLQRPILLTRLLWKGDVRPVLPGNGHRGLTWNYGGQQRKWTSPIKALSQTFLELIVLESTYLCCGTTKLLIHPQIFARCVGSAHCVFSVVSASGLYAGHPSMQVVGPVDRARPEVRSSSTLI